MRYEGQPRSFAHYSLEAEAEVTSEATDSGEIMRIAQFFRLLRIIKLFRIIRIFKLARHIGALKALGKTCKYRLIAASMFNI